MYKIAVLKSRKNLNKKNSWYRKIYKTNKNFFFLNKIINKNKLNLNISFKAFQIDIYEN